MATGRAGVLADRRGSGGSDKPHDPRAYGDNAAARDVEVLLDHLGAAEVDLLAYFLAPSATPCVSPSSSLEPGRS